MEKKIPARIIQTWKSKQLPGRYRKYQSRLRELNPNFEFLLFTDQEIAAFVQDEYPEFQDTFENIPTIISKTDLFRLLAVHKLGGFYLDLDVLLTRPLEALRKESCVFPFERQADPFFCVTYGQIECLGQFAFAATAGHPFLMACMENIRRALSDRQWANLPPPEVTATFLATFGSQRMLEIYYTTGPVIVTRTYAERPDLNGSIKVIRAFNQDTEKFEKWCFGLYGIHAMEGSWKPANGPLFLSQLYGRCRTYWFTSRLQRRLLKCTETFQH